jgi:hypothetical protein
MKTIPLFILASVLATAGRANSRFFAEGGASLVLLSKADVQTSSSYNVVSPSHDRTKGAPFVAAGISFSEHFRVRLSYHYLGNLESAATNVLRLPSIAPYDVYTRFSDHVHIVGFAPELSWPIGRRVSLNISPVLNWVASRGAIYLQTNAPNVTLIPKVDHREDDFTLGGAAGLSWRLGERTDAVFNYQYTNLRPSFGRTAQLLSAGLHWRF